MDFFGFRIAEDCICEISDCGRIAQDINHIQCRGMGGNPKKDKDDISNLMAMCRQHHLKHGDVPKDKAWLRQIHLNYMANNGLH